MKDKAGAIILPDQDGVADLEIRRVIKELEEVHGDPNDMHGYMPAGMVEPAVKELKNMIAAVERGDVQSLCLIAIIPCSPTVDSGSCFFGALSDDLAKIDQLFHLGLAERMEEPDDDEAG